MSNTASTHRVPQRGIGLSISDVEKTFAGGVRAVDRLSLEVEAGQFTALIGPSGCGKSTLLRMIAGLETQSAGAIKRLSPPRQADRFHRDIAYVFQDAHLLPWRTVLGNVALPLELIGMPRSDREAQAAELLRRVGLGDALRHYPAQLSGGMRMRVSLARALVTTPGLLLLDEPFAALDEITRQQLDEWLRQLWSEHQMTVIFVTHSIAEATFLADRAIVFSSRPARVLLDHRLSDELPARRRADLRGTPGFAAQTRVLYDALGANGTGLA